MRGLALLAVLPAATAAASVKRRPAERQVCEIVEAGYYRTAGRTTHTDDSSPTGDRYASDDVEFVTQTRTIARTVGKSFGVRYRLRLPPDRDVKITTKITYPKPLNGKPTWLHPQTWWTGSGELVQHMGYTFDYDWEIVPGPWRMEILVEDKPTCTITFTVK